MVIDVTRRIILGGKLFLNRNLKIARLMLPNLLLFFEVSHNFQIGMCFYILILNSKFVNSKM